MRAHSVLLPVGFRVYERLCVCVCVGVGVVGRSLLTTWAIPSLVQGWVGKNRTDPPSVRRLFPHGLGPCHVACLQHPT